MVQISPQSTSTNTALPPEAKHLKGFGAVDRNTKGITEWLKEIKQTK